MKEGSGGSPTWYKSTNLLFLLDRVEIPSQWNLLKYWVKKALGFSKVALEISCIIPKLGSKIPQLENWSEK